MARELPRTLKTLSSDIQKDIDADEYEIIVVDNGSSIPFDEKACKQACHNTRFIYHKVKSVSPVNAINVGVSSALGDQIGIMVDGARMASPRILRSAIDIISLSESNIVGTYAFHLGEMVQMQSLNHGYNQRVEDELLTTVDWRENPYELFNISVFAGSSSRGWFSVPAESNAIFMHRSMWEKLQGYDERFVAPGGGLANLDFWYRACQSSVSEIFMLLGEGTFHQFHGGVATNSAESKWDDFNSEYKSIRGCFYSVPEVDIKHYGSLSHISAKSILDSANNLLADNSQ